MILAVPNKQAAGLMKKAEKLGEKAHLVGEVIKGKQVVVYKD
jgi:hypothetical protein